MTMTSTPNVQIVVGTNLGNATFSSPVRQRRNTRRGTLSASAINAIRLNNKLAGDTGNVLPVPSANRALFSPAPPDPTSLGTPSTLGTVRSQTQSAPTPQNVPQSIPRPPNAPAGRTIVVDGHPLRLSQMPANQDDFIVARL